MLSPPQIPNESGRLSPPHTPSQSKPSSQTSGSVTQSPKITTLILSALPSAITASLKQTSSPEISTYNRVNKPSPGGITAPSIEKPSTVVPLVLISKPFSSATPSHASLTFTPETLN